MRIYAVGDIHGRLDLLEDCLGQIDRDIALHPDMTPLQIFLGDYIDRGAMSRQTIDRLIARGMSHACMFLKGNHELVAMQALRDLPAFAHWMRLGGVETLMSYDIAPVISSEREDLLRAQMAFQARLPAAHFRFFAGLRSHYALGNFFFVHAGVRPGVALDRQKVEDLLWIREPFLSWQLELGALIVHGHTPTPEVDVRCNRINIDTGAYSSGRLSCLVASGSQLHVMDTAGCPTA